MSKQAAGWTASYSSAVRACARRGFLALAPCLSMIKVEQSVLKFLSVSLARLARGRVFLVALYMLPLETTMQVELSWPGGAALHDAACWGHLHHVNSLLGIHGSSCASWGPRPCQLAPAQRVFFLSTTSHCEGTTLSTLCGTSIFWCV